MLSIFMLFDRKYFCAFLIAMCRDFIMTWFPMVTRWKEILYLMKTSRIVWVDWHSNHSPPFNWDVFISWLYVTPEKKFDVFYFISFYFLLFETMSCHLLCFTLLLTLPCYVASASFPSAVFWDSLANIVPRAGDYPCTHEDQQNYKEMCCRVTQ